jgi:hypothetical protein
MGVHPLFTCTLRTKDKRRTLQRKKNHINTFFLSLFLSFFEAISRYIEGSHSHSHSHSHSRTSRIKNADADYSARRNKKQDVSNIIDVYLSFLLQSANPHTVTADYFSLHKSSIQQFHCHSGPLICLYLYRTSHRLTVCYRVDTPTPIPTPIPTATPTLHLPHIRAP